MSWTADYEERKTRETVENFLDSRPVPLHNHSCRTEWYPDCPACSAEKRELGPVKFAAPKWYDQLGQPLWATWAEPWAEGWLFQGNPIGRATNVRVEDGQLKASVSPYVPATAADTDHWAKRSIYCRT